MQAKRCGDFDGLGSAPLTPQAVPAGARGRARRSSPRRGLSSALSSSHGPARWPLPVQFLLVFLWASLEAGAATVQRHARTRPEAWDPARLRVPSWAYALSFHVAGFGACLVSLAGTNFTEAVVARCTAGITLGVLGASLVLGERFKASDEGAIICALAGSVSAALVPSIADDQLLRLGDQLFRFDLGPLCILGVLLVVLLGCTALARCSQGGVAAAAMALRYAVAAAPAQLLAKLLALQIFVAGKPWGTCPSLILCLCACVLASSLMAGGIDRFEIKFWLTSAFSLNVIVTRMLCLTVVWELGKTSLVGLFGTASDRGLHFGTFALSATLVAAALWLGTKGLTQEEKEEQEDDEEDVMRTAAAKEAPWIDQGEADKNEVTQKAAAEEAQRKRQQEEDDKLTAEKVAAEESRRKRLEDEAAAKAAAEESERKRMEREAAEKAAAEESERTRIEREAAEKAAAEYLELKRLEEEAARKAAAEYAEKKRLEEEAKQKAAAEYAERKRLEREAADKAAMEEAERKRLEEEAEHIAAAEAAERKHLEREAARRAAEKDREEKRVQEETMRQAAAKAERTRLANEAAALGEGPPSEAGRFRPGHYRLQQNTSVGPSPAAGEILRVLDSGSVAEIVEFHFVEEDHRVRGRLAEGGWINIKDTNDGHMFALPEDTEASSPVRGSVAGKGSATGGRGRRLRGSSA